MMKMNAEDEIQKHIFTNARTSYKASVHYFVHDVAGSLLILQLLCLYCGTIVTTLHVFTKYSIIK